MIFIESKQQFYEYFNNKPNLVIIYSAGWCKPCTNLKTWLKSSYKDCSVPIIVLDVDHMGLQELTEDVQGMPTVEFIVDQDVVHRVEGFDQSAIATYLDKLIQRESTHDKRDQQDFSEEDDDNMVARRRSKKESL